MLTDEWLSKMYEQDYALLYRVGRVFLGNDPARESLIEDQIQETFVRAWLKRAALKKHPNPDGWLVECFRKCLMNACRKQSREWACPKSVPFPAQGRSDSRSARLRYAQCKGRLFASRGIQCGHHRFRPFADLP